MLHQLPVTISSLCSAFELPRENGVPHKLLQSHMYNHMRTSVLPKMSLVISSYMCCRKPQARNLNPNSSVLRSRGGFGLVYFVHVDLGGSESWHDLADPGFSSVLAPVD